MITRIEILKNGLFRVETVGVGCAKCFEAESDAMKEARRLQAIFKGEIFHRGQWIA